MYAVIAVYDLLRDILGFRFQLPLDPGHDLFNQDILLIGYGN